MRFLTSLALLLLMQTAAFAEGGMSTRGVGTSTCGKFGKMYADDPQKVELIFYSWAQGYWSARNENLILTKGQYRDISGEIENQERLLRSYCNQNPLATYREAASSVYNSFPLKASK
jgi:hypothetical protein